MSNLFFLHRPWNPISVHKGFLLSWLSHGNFLYRFNWYLNKTISSMKQIRWRSIMRTKKQINRRRKKQFQHHKTTSSPASSETILLAEMPVIRSTPSHCCCLKFSATYPSASPFHHKSGHYNRRSQAQHMKPLLLWGKKKNAALAAPWLQPVTPLETEKEGLGVEGKPMILGKENK